MKKIIAAFLLALAPLAACAEDGIRFDTVILESGERISSPSVWFSFGQEAVVEVPGKVRIVARAAAPDGDRSEVAARLYYFADGSGVLDEEMSMRANIAQTPSFEKTMGNNLHRVVVMPRAATKP
jgi:hypothetical protein